MNRFQKLVINIAEENISQKYRSKNIDQIKNYFIKEIDRNELMSKEHQQLSRFFNYIEYLLILVSAITECVTRLRNMIMGQKNSEI